MENKQTSARTQQAVETITQFYNTKIDTDYEKIIDMIENGGDNLTRRDFIVTLGINDTVLDSFFNLVVRGCDGEERDAICDRLITINRDDLHRIVKKLKNENIHLEDEILSLREQLEASSGKDCSELVQKVSELESIITEKDEYIASLIDNGPNGYVHPSDGSVYSHEEHDHMLQDQQDYSAELSELKMQIEQLQTENYTLRESVDAAASQKWELEEQVRQLTSDVNEKDIRIYELENTQHSAQIQEDPWGENQPVSDSQEIEEYKNKVFELESEKESLLYQIQSLQSQDHGSDNQMYETEEKIRSLESELLAKNEYIQRLEHEAYALTGEIDNHKARIRDLEAALESNILDTAPSGGQENWSNTSIDFGASMSDEPVKKEKSKAGLWIIVGSLFFILLILVAVTMINSNNGPVPGTPTAIPANEKITGNGLSANVANGAATQLPPQTAQQVAGAPVIEAVPTAIEPVQAPVAQNGIVKTLQSPYDFRKNAAHFAVSDQGLILEGQLYKVGDSINGFRILAIQKTFVRILDPKNDLEFRLDIGA
ncbi:MAG: hypothetical protein M1300_07365 [Epsilonproteobacteria bacterium]|nr:hypothetical protein [Campylobacterota bacterium]